jgi:hypothetical protein
MAGCEAGTTAAPPSAAPAPGVAFAQPPPPAPPAPTPTPPARAAARIELTAVTLADDCGGAAPYQAPAQSHTRVKGAASAARSDRQRARCEQTSMQLAIIADDAATLQIKSVELFDESGTSLGTLTASKPTRWSAAKSIYEAWDESVAADSTSNVSYVLSQPSYPGDRWNRTFLLKTVVSVGGVDQTAQKSVTISVSAPTALPPNVRT